MPKPIPEGYHTITPFLVFKDVRKAIDFYKKAFGAVEKFAMQGPNGKGITHAEVKIGDSIFMLSPENKQKSAETLGDTPVGFYLYVENCDVSHKRALGAGARELMPPQEMFWGDCMSSVKDPFGYIWSFATHTRDLTPDQIAKGAQEFYSQTASK